MTSRPFQRIDVHAASPYRIFIGPGLMDHGQSLSAQIRGRDVFIITDDTVAPHYLQRVTEALLRTRSALRIGHYTIPAGEASKTLTQFSAIMEQLALAGLRRDACMIALGGGVVGDLAGFSAACWMRGIDCVQMPTSLLAMVDSSVGGKTGVDLLYGKNLVGAFHPPRAVLADTLTLRTLPPRELRAGLAEVIKYGAIVDAAFLDWLENHADALLALDDVALTAVIARSCTHKAAIVGRDPFEHGERALLNFGHTFAHAIETTQGYGGLNHGEAVAVGMVLAARLSERLGMAQANDTARLYRLLERFGLPLTIPPGLDATTLLAYMHLDKKAQASGLRFILWRRAGNAEICTDIPENAVLDVLNATMSG